MAKDYYQVLGLEKNASEEDIKKAYRRLVHKYHPDRPEGDEGKFKEISEAYQTLSDRNKKAQYDQFGSAFPGAGGWGAAPGGFNVDWNAGGFGDLGEVFADLFEQFGAGRKKQTYRHGSDVELIYEITLEDAFQGVERTIKFQTFVSCGLCGGLGHEKNSGFKKCEECKGEGDIREEKRTFFGAFSQVKSCPTCFGKGEIPNKICGKCGNVGRVPGTKEVKIKLSPGVENGQVVKIQGVGEAGEQGGKTGDLYVVVKVKSHKTFYRRGADLFINREIRITDALLGRGIKVENIDGEYSNVSIPSGFNFQNKLKVEECGMPRFSPGGNHTKRGDLYVTFNLEIPRKISKKAREFLEKLDEELK